MFGCVRIGIGWKGAKFLGALIKSETRSNLVIMVGQLFQRFAVSALVNRLLGGAADQVTRLGGRFASMVLMPQELTLQITAQGAGWVLFELLNEGQAPVIKEGFMVWSQGSAAII
jgi:hypothetical protein